MTDPLNDLLAPIRERLHARARPPSAGWPKLPRHFDMNREYRRGRRELWRIADRHASEAWAGVPPELIQCIAPMLAEDPPVFAVEGPPPDPDAVLDALFGTADRLSLLNGLR